MSCQQKFLDKKTVFFDFVLYICLFLNFGCVLDTKLFSDNVMAVLSCICEWLCEGNTWKTEMLEVMMHRALANNITKSPACKYLNVF